MKIKVLNHLGKKKFKTTMLEYQKNLLSKISFSQELLIKEYQKGRNYLNKTEQAELRQWFLFITKNEQLKQYYYELESHSKRKKK